MTGRRVAPARSPRRCCSPPPWAAAPTSPRSRASSSSGPTKDAWWGYRNAGLAYEERWIPVGANGDKLHAFWAPADDKAAPMMLYLHGARWNLTGSVTRIERWRKLGFTVLAIDYRGFGKSTDVSPSEQLAYEDAEAAWDYLAQAGPARQRYIVGHSLGGAIAAELALRRPDASGVVLEATFTSIRDMVEHTAWRVLPVGLILTQEFDTLAKMPRDPRAAPHHARHERRDRALRDGRAALRRGHGARSASSRSRAAATTTSPRSRSDQYRAALQELFRLAPRALEVSAPALTGGGAIFAAMQSLDLDVLENALAWRRAGRRAWLVTVAQTFGASPRPPGSLLAMRDDGILVGSVSGGCIEDDLVARREEFAGRAPALRLLRRHQRGGAPLRPALRRRARGDRRGRGAAWRTSRRCWRTSRAAG